MMLNKMAKQIFSNSNLLFIPENKRKVESTLSNRVALEVHLTG